MTDVRLEARLFVLSGSDLARSFVLGERSVLGRAEECEVVLSDRSISRKHALIARAEGGWFVQDLGSTNGIARGGQRAERLELADGDEFKLGDLAVRFKLVPAGEEELDFADHQVAPPAPKPAPAVRRPAPRVEQEIELEIELDQAPAPITAPAGAQRREPLAATHFHAPRAARSSGLLAGDLEQRPLWLRFLLGVVVFGLAGALAYGAFLVVRLLRAG